MKVFQLTLTLVAASSVSPIEKTIQLLTDLQAKVTKTAEKNQKLYEEFAEWCEDVAKETQFEIKTLTADGERASAAIAQETSKSNAAAARIEELASSISTSQGDLAAATEIRNKEAAAFAKADADLAETIDMIGRAAGIIEKEMQGGASLMQGADMDRITSALQTIVEATSIDGLDKARVQALLQSGEEEMQPAGAPEAAAYESHSGDILSVLEDMSEKAKAQRAAGQRAEMESKHNFELLKQKLDDSVAAESKEKKEKASAQAAAEEALATAQGELATANKDNAAAQAKLSDLHSNCMTKATEHETNMKELDAELDALKAATKIIGEKTGGATSRTYSFLQVGLRGDATDRAIAMIQKIARAEKSTEFAQFGSRLRAVSRMAANPFDKIKGLISKMIEQLTAEAQQEADHKAYCDEELSETKEKREDKEDHLDNLNTKIDKATAKIASLKERISTLESELAAIAKAQAAATALRGEEKEAWAAAKADFESGIEGVTMALQILRDYYGASEALVQTGKEEGAASGIIGMLEVVLSDFSKMLAEGTASENSAQSAYDQTTQDNKVATAEKTTEAKYSTKDLKETTSRLEGLEGERGVAQTELDAIMEYWNKLQPICVAKAEPYAERKKRREAEIAGLKEALRILEEESAPAFLQIRKA